MKNEIWRDVPPYMGLYQASSLGRIKSLSKKTKRKGNSTFMSKEKILKPYFNKRGYWLSVRKRWISDITVNNKRKRIGSFKSEEEAAKAYQQELSRILTF